MVNNEIDHKTDLVGKYFVDGIIKLGCNILNGITPSSEFSFSDNTIYEEFAISAIISKYQSWLIDDYEDDVLNSKSIDYTSIIDKMNVNMDNDVQLSHANVKIPLGCKFLMHILINIFTCFCKVIIKETNIGCCIGHVLTVNSGNKINNIEVGDQIVAINGINAFKKNRIETNSIMKNEIYHEKNSLTLSLLRYNISTDGEIKMKNRLKALFKKEANKLKKIEKPPVLDHASSIPLLNVDDNRNIPKQQQIIINR